MAACKSTMDVKPISTVKDNPRAGHASSGGADR